MDSNKVLTPKRLFWLAIILTALTYFSYKQLASKAPSFTAEIIQRSHNYIEKFESTDFKKLSMEDKLLLFHSYYNISAHVKVIELYKKLASDIAVLPKDRREAFLNMVDNAKKRK